MFQVPNFSSSTEEESATKSKSCLSSHIGISQKIQMVLPELVRPRMLSYEHSPFQFDYTPEKKPFMEPQSHLPFHSIPQMQQDFPLQLESQEFITRLGDPNFLDVFGHSTDSALGIAQIPIETSCFGPETCSHISVKVESHDIVAPDIFMDDFPPIDMFDPIEPLPSPSDWSSMDWSFGHSMVIAFFKLQIF